MVRIAVFLLVCSIAGCPAVALGQPGADDPDRARSLALYEEAARLYQRGEFGASAELLRQAYEGYRHPTLLYNLGRATEGLGDLSGAVAAYEAYLESAPDSPDASMVRARIATLRRTIGERDALLVARVRAIRERDQLAAQIEHETPASHTAWPWVVTAVGLIGAGTGGVLFALALDAESDARVEPAQREAFRLHSRAETFETWGAAALIGGGALALVGLSWWLYGQLFEPHVEGFRTLTLSLEPASLGAEILF